MNNEILLLLLVNLISGIGYSLVAPLYPNVAINKGLSEFFIGFIISMYAISNLITVPFAGKIFQIFGKKRAFLFALSAEVINNNITNYNNMKLI